MRENDTVTTMQTSMLISLCLLEAAKGQGDLIPLQCTREFFKEMLMIVRWQSWHTGLVNQLVANGWLAEHVASHGTSFYCLTAVGRNIARDYIERAERSTFAFIPQNRTLFDITNERE